jgi:putative nucleotidyltransferase with HDIG domain
MMDVTREQAWALLRQYTESPNLIKHALAVEAAMRAYARHFGEDEERWGIVGLIHDFDYEQYPTMDGDTPREQWHTYAGARILRERGWPQEIVQDVLSHADYVEDAHRDTLLRKALYAVDELTGLVIAVALVRPSKSILDVQVKSVRKKEGQGLCRGGQPAGRRRRRSSVRRRAEPAHRHRAGSAAGHRR